MCEALDNIEDLKKCTKCSEVKMASTDFYHYQGKPRAECKKCTSQMNVACNRERKRIHGRRPVNKDQARQYMRGYYARNKENFAEYRRRFYAKHPGYAKAYAKAHALKKKQEAES